MPIPSDQVSLMENAGTVVSIPTLNVFPKQVVASSVITVAPTIYPIAQVYILNNTNWLNVRVGQQYEIRDAEDHLVTYGVIRKLPQDDVVYIDGKARGDPGIAENLLRAIDVGQTITVYTYQPLWTLLSRIVDKTFYKKYDQPYTDEGTKPPPQLNLGQWRVYNVGASGNTAQVTMTAADNVAWNGATITGYSWELPDDAVIISGDIDEEVVTFTLPQGFYIVYCVITDSNGKTQSAMRPIWVNGDDYAPIAEGSLITIVSDSQDLSGRDVSLEISGISEEIDIPVDAAFIYTKKVYYDGNELDTGILVDLYVGFNSGTTKVYSSGGELKLKLNLLSPYKIMALQPMASQAVLEVETGGTPQTWAEVAVGLGIPNFIVFYLLNYHQSFLQLFDFFGLQEESQPRKKLWGFSGTGFTGYLEQLAVMIRKSNIGCLSDGTLVLARNPIYEEQDYREELDERFTYRSEGILNTAPEITKPLYATIGHIKVYTMVYNGETPEAYGSIAPGYHQGQGQGASDEEGVILKPGEGQVESNRLSGHIYAATIAPVQEINLELFRCIDIAEPARMLWYRVQIPAQFAPDNKEVDMRGLITNVDRTWEYSDLGSAIESVNITFKPESFGQPGETFDLNRGMGDEYEPIEPIEEDELFSIVVAWNSNGKLGRTFDGEFWEDIAIDIPGKVCDACIDWWSEYPQSGYIYGNFGMYFISSDENIISVWYVDDILAEYLSITEIAAYEVEDTSVQISARIRSSKRTQDFVAIAWRTLAGGTMMVRAYDGVNFETPFYVSASIDTQILNNDAELGFDIDGEAQFISAPVSSNDYRVYYAATKEAVPVQYSIPYLSDGKFSTQPCPMIYMQRGSNNVFISRIVSNSTNVTASKTVDTPSGTVSETSILPVGQIVSDGQLYIDVSASSSSEFNAKIDLGGSSPNALIKGDYARSISELSVDAPQIISMEIGHYWALYASARLEPSSLSSRRITQVGYNVTFAMQLPIFALASATDLSDAGIYTLIPSGIRDLVWELGINLIDDNNNVVWTSPVETTTLGTGPYTLSVNSVMTGSGLYYYFTAAYKNIDATYTVSPSVDYVVKIQPYIKMQNENAVIGVSTWTHPSTGTRTYLSLFAPYISATYNKITTSSRNLYKVANYTGTPTITDITPDDYAIPDHIYGFMLDTNNINQPTMAGADEYEARNVYSSVDGIEFTNERQNTGYVGLIRNGQFRLYWGYDRLDLSQDGDANIINILGDWPDAIGDIDKIRGVIALI